MQSASELMKHIIKVVRMWTLTLIILNLSVGVKHWSAFDSIAARSSDKG